VGRKNQGAAGSWQLAGRASVRAEPSGQLAKMIKSFRELTVYKRAFESAMRIFEATKLFPKEEQYALTGQIRRSSRSICTNAGEAWRKRRYPAHFVSKLTDADAEATETIVWLDFALACKYIDMKEHEELVAQYEEIGKMLGSMISAPEKFCYAERKARS
jgi:four helix bundle protein